MRVFRRMLSTAVVVGLAAVGFVGVAAAPAGADALGYTIQVQYPQGAEAGPMCRLAKVDLATGAVTPIGSYLAHTTYACATDLAFSPTGQLYGIAQTEVFPGFGPPRAGSEFEAQNGVQVHLVRFDLTTGAVTDLGAIGTGSSTLTPFLLPGGGITFDSAGNLWVYMVSDGDGCSGDAFCLFQVNPSNPADVTYKGDGPQETYLFGLTTACNQGVHTSELTQAIIVDDALVWLGGDTLDAVNTTNGSVSHIGSGYGDGKYIQSLDFGADGTLHGIGILAPNGFAAPGYLYTVNTATGVATTGAKLSASSSSTIVQGLAVAAPTCPTPPAPEPAPAAVVTPRFTG